MPSERLKNKIYRYAVFFFPESQSVGTSPTANICNGYKSIIRMGQYVKLNWEGQIVWGII